MIGIGKAGSNIKAVSDNSGIIMLQSPIAVVGNCGHGGSSSGKGGKVCSCRNYGGSGSSGHNCVIGGRKSGGNGKAVANISGTSGDM